MVARTLAHHASGEVTLEMPGALDAYSTLPQRRLRLGPLPLPHDGRRDGSGARKQGSRSLTTEELRSG